MAETYGFFNESRDSFNEHMTGFNKGSFIGNSGKIVVSLSFSG